MEKNDIEKLTLHLNRITENLNQHWHSITLLLSHVSKPLTVDDRGLAHTLHNFRDDISKFISDFKELDIAKHICEIKYIGKRLNKIEETLSQIKEKGLTKNIQLDFTIDGYEMVKKPIAYNPKDQIEKPNDILDELLKTLSNRESQTIIHRFGLFGQKKKTYDEIGAIFGTTSESVRQTLSKALRKLRHPNRKKLMEKVTHSALRKEVFGE